jgi:hypothetical protein
VRDFHILRLGAKEHFIFYESIQAKEGDSGILEGSLDHFGERRSRVSNARSDAHTREEACPSGSSRGVVDARAGRAVSAVQPILLAYQ